MRTFYLRTLSGGLLNQRTLGANQAVYSKTFVYGHHRAGGPPSWQSKNAFAVLRCTSVRMIHVAEPVKVKRHRGVHQEGRDKTHRRW